MPKQNLSEKCRLERNRKARQHRLDHPEAVRASERKRYLKGRSKRLALGALWRKKNIHRAYEISRKTLARLETIKTINPCMDCHQRFPPECIDFDHRPGTDKVMGVGHMVASRYSWARIEAEILKCDAVCANCHRIRTKDRLRVRRIEKAA